jgi:predicted nuclease of predicted toxin-antitoxin system
MNGKSFRVKLDENLGYDAAEFLRDSGYDALTVYEEHLAGATDETLWRTICMEQRLLVTLDMDFADVRAFPPGTHPGLVLLRPSAGSASRVLQILRRVVQEQPLEDLAGCLTVADESHTRIRRPPP